jgi:hypothetical protein
MLFSHDIPTPQPQPEFLVIDGVPRDMKISNFTLRRKMRCMSGGPTDGGCSWVAGYDRVPRHQISREGVLTSDLQRGALCCHVMLD